MSNLTAEAREIATKLTSILNTQYPQIDWPFQTMTVIVDDVLTALIAKVRGGERERCAVICDDYPKRDPAEDGNGYWAAAECAALIRKEPQP